MPHYTKTGDDGTTSLMGEGRVPKHHQQPETFGAIDEATSALGLARALSTDNRVDAHSREIQQRFYLIMAELAVAAETPVPEEFITRTEHVERLEAMATELEAIVPPPTTFVLPGATVVSGALDLARTITRRAERETSRLQAAGLLRNPEVLRYLNRASSVLYDLARYEEYQADRPAPPATRHNSDPR